jgi:two-component system cell cycle sensor histidine kinase/response regulator CckA
MMMTKGLVLLVDDDPIQLKLGAIRLRGAGFDVETASGGEEALTKVERRVPDAIVSDVLMGDLDGFGLCRRLRSDPALASVPIILLSAHYRDQPDQTLAEHVGASALLLRTPDFDDELAALIQLLDHKQTPHVRVSRTSAYEEHLRTNAHQLTKLLGRAETAEGLYRALFNSANDAISVMSADGICLEANARWGEITGRDPRELVGRTVRDFAAPGQADANADGYLRAVQAGSNRIPAVPIAKADGAIVYLDFALSNIEVGGETRIFAIGRDVTEQTLAARRLAISEEKHRNLLERLPDVVWTTRLDGTITFMTANAEQVLGYTSEELMAEDLAVRMERVHPHDRERVQAAYGNFTESGVPFDLEYRRQRKDGGWIWLRNRATATYQRDGIRYIEGMISDITERKRLEDSFHLAQRMEAMGQLTGGIAHDFNNILCVILAMGQLLSEDLGPQDPRRADAQEIVTAAERAAALTRQLLAFSRHQILEPTVVDVNTALHGIEKMLRRLIGEDIALSVLPGEGAGSVRVDVGQLEQVIMNLAVNARDAMPHGGQLVIETGNVDIDDDDDAAELGAAPGSYVMIAVSDTGCGMNAETRRRIFEPFFTTKEIGKGTGLGLATCYGIVKQSGGHISVRSELEQGSIFEIYLPRVDSAVDVARPRRTAVLDGHETILLVEDDERVRTSVARMLTPRGYRLLVAPTPGAAVELAAANPIDLVLSDVVMPHASGPTVVARIEELIGKIRVLYMSGYTDHPHLRIDQLADGVNFVQKPFGPETLARKVREALDR